MKRKTKTLLRILLLAILVGGVLFFFFNRDKEQNFYREDVYKKVDLKIGGNAFVALLADNEDLRMKGLSGFSGLKKSEVMFFVFEKPGILSFWMKDMLFPLDIVWLDENMKIVFFEKNILPESYPKLFGPNFYTQYVVEFVGGTIDKLNIKLGDSVISRWREW